MWREHVYFLGLPPVLTQDVFIPGPVHGCARLFFMLETHLPHLRSINAPAAVGLDAMLRRAQSYIPYFPFPLQAYFNTLDGMRFADHEYDNASDGYVCGLRLVSANEYKIVVRPF